MIKDFNVVGKKFRLSALLLSGASYFAIVPAVLAQQTIDTTQKEDKEEDLVQEVIEVTGIRASLASSAMLKRYSNQIMDSITAEDMGKFPDTNLAESLQRIPGVSIDRRRGEGSRVTVRGFGPAFNLVLLNGRKMATAFMQGNSIPTSRDFDFATIGSDAIAGVDVSKTGSAQYPTGGIGSVIYVKTTRPLEQPGLRFTMNIKGISDNSVTTLGSESITPEVSVFYKDTFENDTIGVKISASVQDRDSGFAQFGVTSGYRGFYRGYEGGWGVLPTPPNDTQVTNRPGENQIYGAPQNGNYSLTHLSSGRTNYGLVLQYRPIPNLTSTLDYFYSELKVDERRSDMSVWFNHGNVTSGWGDGNIADILFYNESFDWTDLSMGANQIGALVTSDVLAVNFEFNSYDGFSLILDAHTASAKAEPNSPSGTAGTLGTADHALNFQGLDFRSKLPALSLGFQSPHTDISADRMLGTGSVFQAALIDTNVEAVRLEGTYEFDDSNIKSVSFGVSSDTNKYRGTFTNNQRDSWGGVGNVNDYPDDIWRRANLANNFDGFAGHESTFQDFFIIDFAKLVKAMDKDFTRKDDNDNDVVTFSAVCGGDGNCINDRPVSNDFRTTEETATAFLNVDVGYSYENWDMNFSTGLRLERSKIKSSGLVGIPTGTAWVAENELNLRGLGDAANRNFTIQEGNYEYALPSFNFNVLPNDEIVLRAGWSKTLTRPHYNEIRGGLSVDQLFRIDGGSGTSGNPNLKPYVSTNTDFSAEWYYGEISYFALAYFGKKVENFIGATVEIETPFNVYTPINGKRYRDAVAELGDRGNDLNAIRQHIFRNADSKTFRITETRQDGTIVGEIYGVPGEDPQLSFRITKPLNVRTTKVSGWEISWQHAFGDSGFGFVGNYTILSGDDATFDNSIVPSDNVATTTIVGLSDSYNLSGYYDKNGVQVRLSYSWRDKYLSSTIGVSGTVSNPLYEEDYGQVDFSSSYKVSDNLSVFLEGINVTDETGKSIGRSPSYVYFLTQNGSRYFFGARYVF